MGPSAFQMQSQFYRPNPLTVDTNAEKYFNDEDSGLIDDGILDQSAVDSGLEMSPPMAGSRRDSFTLFSPKTEDWQSVDMQSVPSNTGANPFLEPQHSTNPFARGDQSQASYPSAQPWSMGPASGTCTPFQYDGLDNGYEGGSSLFQRPMPVQTPFSNPGGQIPLFSTVGPNSQSIPASPRGEWMGHELKGQSMAKRMRPGSPTIRSHNELRRGDGIRKKNARFDIPAERNLSNIDHLISQSTDEQEIKELKQQKRLLRNRQAALDSRQRKKLHTERLEDEKKAYQNHITSLEDEITELSVKLEQMCHERDFFEQQSNGLRMEKEEMIQTHTLEGNQMRKKCKILESHVQRLETAAMPSNAGFPNGFNEMDGMTMDTPWDNMGFMGPEFPPVETEVKQELQVVPAKKTQQISLPADMEKPANQGGLLFMLFLVGAFVLSNRSTPNIPRVSDDMREASATLLDNIFKDAGVANAPEASMAPAAPQPSGVSWESAPSMPMATDHPMGDVAPSMLGELSDSLTQPTQEQTNEQIFGLSAAQYNNVQDPDFLNNPSTRQANQGRRNLADALANMGGGKKQSAAEVYTRSLLWEQIPADVVRDFARFVAENSNANDRPQQQRANEATTS